MPAAAHELPRCIWRFSSQVEAPQSHNSSSGTMRIVDGDPRTPGADCSMSQLESIPLADNVDNPPTGCKERSAKGVDPEPMTGQVQATLARKKRARSPISQLPLKTRKTDAAGSQHMMPSPPRLSKPHPTLLGLPTELQSHIAIYVSGSSIAMLCVGAR